MRCLSCCAVVRANDMLAVAASPAAADAAELVLSIQCPHHAKLYNDDVVCERVYQHSVAVVCSCTPNGE